jgi:hypothetical protein
MERIPLAQRRAVLQEKLRGASHQEAADRVGVSKGTVVNVFNAAKAGQYDAFEDVEDQVNALAELSKRLEAEDLDVTAAHTGLDILEWLDDLKCDPDALASFRDKLETFAADDTALESYFEAALRLQTVEELTGYTVNEELTALLDLLSEQDGRAIERLLTIGERASALDIDHLETAIDTALDLQADGFDLTVADRLAAELADRSDDSPAAAVEALVECYGEYDSLETAIADAQAEQAELEATIETLSEERDQHDAAITRLESTLKTQEATLEELTALRGDLQEDIERRRAERQAIGAEVEEVEANLQQIQAEREVVHAYRRLIREEKLPPAVLQDIIDLFTSDEIPGETPTPALEPPRYQGVKEALLRVLEEMRTGEEYITVEEHEAALEKAHDIARDLDDLEEEWTAVKAFLQFLDTGELSEMTLDELRKIKKGRADYLSETRREEEVNDFLIEQLEELTEGHEAISKRRHRDELERLRTEFLADLQASYRTLYSLRDEFDALSSHLEAEWMRGVAEAVVAELPDEETGVSESELEGTLQTVFEDEVQRRFQAEFEDYLMEEIHDRLSIERQQTRVKVS